MEKDKLPACNLLSIFILIFILNGITASCVVRREISEVRLSRISWDSDYYYDSDEKNSTTVTYEYDIKCNNTVLNPELLLQSQTTKVYQEEASKSKIIRVEDSTLSKISTAIFKDFNSVEQLYLVNNSISAIEPEALNMPMLVIILLNNNALTEIREGTFNKLSKLKTIYLQHNQIVSFESFQNCKSLSTIKLDYNNITTINETHFRNLTNLMLIQLNNNKIYRIHPNAFFNLHFRIDLKLQYNALQTLPENLFDNIFVNLNISHNHLKELTFRNLTDEIYYSKHIRFALRDVDLSYNDLTSVPKNINYINRRPTNLNLSNNKITTVGAQDFVEINQTITLNLSRNKIETIEIGSFNDLPQLSSLDLSFNKINELKPGVFTGLNQLKTLNLSHNKLTHFNSAVFNSMDSVEEIDYSGNYLNSLNTSEFEFRNLKYINLDFHHISCHNLMQYLHAFSTHHITVRNGITFDSENIRGIACDHRMKLNHTTTTTTTSTTISTTSVTTPTTTPATTTTTTTTSTTTPSTTTATTTTSLPVISPVTEEETTISSTTSFDLALKSSDVIPTESSHTVLITMIVLTLVLGTGVGIWFGRKYYLNRYKNSNTHSQYSFVNEIQM